MTTTASVVCYMILQGQEATFSYLATIPLNPCIADPSMPSLFYHPWLIPPLDMPPPCRNNHSHPPPPGIHLPGLPCEKLKLTLTSSNPKATSQVPAMVLFLRIKVYTKTFCWTHDFSTQGLKLLLKDGKGKSLPPLSMWTDYLVSDASITRRLFP